MSEWIEATLGDVCHVYQPKTLAQKQLRPGNFPVFGANGQIGWHDEYNHESSQLLIGCRGSVGFVHMTSGPAWINGNAMVVIPSEGMIDRDFLAYALKGGIDISPAISGAAQPQITRTSLAPLAIRFPSKVDEQRRIVAILDEAFEGIATAKANSEKILQDSREIFSARMQLIFQENENWERVPLQVLMERGWITSHLDGNHGSEYPRKEEFVESGVPYIAAAAIRDGRVDFSEAKYLSPSRAASIRKGLAKDRDVLFAHNATVGPVATLRTDEEFVILGTSLTYYRCDPQHICPEYLAHYMVSPEFTSQYVQVMRQSTRNQVPITKQREFLHVIPPIDIQMRIAEELDELSIQTARLVDVAERKIDAFDELKKSLLHQAFTGQL